MEDVQTGTTSAVDDALLLTLSDADVQESLVAALQKLPKLMELLDTAERSLEFVQAVLQDKESMKGLLAGLDEELGGVNIDKSTVVGLVTLIDKLPKLVRFVSLFEQVADITEAIVTDQESLAQITSSVAQWTDPVRSKVQDGMSIVNEAKQRAAKDRTTVSLFGALKLLKDPTVQRGLRFVNAALAVINERNRDSGSRPAQMRATANTNGVTFNS